MLQRWQATSYPLRSYLTPSPVRGSPLPVADRAGARSAPINGIHPACDRRDPLACSGGRSLEGTANLPRHNRSQLERSHVGVLPSFGSELPYTPGPRSLSSSTTECMRGAAPLCTPGRAIVGRHPTGLCSTMRAQSKGEHLCRPKRGSSSDDLGFLPATGNSGLQATTKLAEED